MRIARRSAALGFMALFATGDPDGYQPSTKYWRIIAAAAAAAGGAELLPAQGASGGAGPPGGFPSHIPESPSKTVAIFGLIRPALVGPRADPGRRSVWFYP